MNELAGDQLALVRKLRQDVDHLSEQNARLKEGGGGGTSGGMDAVDAKIAAAEARTDTKFEQLRADLKEFATSKDLRNNVWGAAVAVITLILAAVAFGGDRFDAGVGVGDMRASQAETDRRQDKSVEDINRKLDMLIERADRPKT